MAGLVVTLSKQGRAEETYKMNCMRDFNQKIAPTDFSTLSGSMSLLQDHLPDAEMMLCRKLQDQAKNKQPDTSLTLEL